MDAIVVSRLRFISRVQSSIVFLLAFLCPSFCADDTPSNMTHVIVRMTGTGIPANSFAAKAKEYWRASNRYCRVDEESDPEKGIHGRTVINEPDAWLVNLADNTAKHLLDGGPTFNCRLPIFSSDIETTKSRIGKLEFGREREFFQSNGAKQIEGPKLEFKANYYELTVEDSVLKFVERADIQAPIFIGLIQQDKVIEVHYLLWDDQVPFKAVLFAAPTGVKIQEVN